MSEFRDYKTLDVWKKSKELANLVYNVTRQFPKEEVFGLVSQMRRSAVSVPSNIAEGVGRGYTKETLQFLSIAKGSLFELETQLYISKDQNFINEKDFKLLVERKAENMKLLSGFRKYYNEKLSKPLTQNP
jgi:four helix bundle protein